MIEFPSYNVTLGEAIEIVKHRLYDDSIAYESKILAIGQVIDMVTLNSVTKDDLLRCLRFLYERYDF